jgi:hypothetical protein
MPEIGCFTDLPEAFLRLPNARIVGRDDDGI